MIRFVLILAILAAMCVGIACFLRPPTEVVREHSEVAEKETLVRTEKVVQVTNRPVEVSNNGYASASSCTRCHEEQHQSWHASYHHTMTQLVTPETAPKAIENTTVSIAGVTFEFTREDDLYFVTINDPMNSSPQVAKKELVMMTGSHHMSVFWYDSSFYRTPAMLPIVLLRDQQRWILRNSSFVIPPGAATPELGRWNQVCSRCHSTHPSGIVNTTPRTPAADFGTHVVDFGIACEACHGPGQDHIKFHDGDQQVKESDDVVVNPEDLPHYLQSDVCGQCHSAQRYDVDMLNRFVVNGMPYRPGDNFEDSPLRQPIRTPSKSQDSPDLANAHDKNIFWSDGTVRVSGREYSGLIESPCYQNGTMSCLSCHEMHPDKSVDLENWRDDQLKPGMRTNHACTQCHQESKYTSQLAQHTHHVADSHGSQCMNCHMPYTTYGLLKSIRSHRIESPSAITALTTGRPNGCMLCHLDRNIGWSADQLTQWYGHQELELMNPMARETASSVVNFLLGDAGIRAIYASAFAWEPAREASGTDWMAPFVIIGLLDDYDAVRIILMRTLRTLPGYEDVDIDELAEIRDRAKVVTRYIQEFKRDLRLKPRSELLIGEDGKLDFDQASQMFNSRDQTPVFLNE